MTLVERSEQTANGTSGDQEFLEGWSHRCEFRHVKVEKLPGVKRREWFSLSGIFFALEDLQLDPGTKHANKTKNASV